MSGDFLSCADDAVELDRASGLDILQHRGLEGAEPAGNGMAVFRLLGDGAADAFADAGGFAHGGGAEFADQRIIEQTIDGRAGQC